MGFCDDIREIRQKCFLSQEAFAKELGVSFATVNRWESGKTKPTYKTMKLNRRSFLDDLARLDIFDVVEPSDFLIAIHFRSVPPFLFR